MLVLINNFILVPLGVNFCCSISFILLNPFIETCCVNRLALLCEHAPYCRSIECIHVNISQFRPAAFLWICTCTPIFSVQISSNLVFIFSQASKAVFFLLLTQTLINGDIWALAVDCAIGRFLDAFIVTNHKDCLALRACAKEAKYHNLFIIVYDFSRPRLELAPPFTCLLCGE